MKSTLRHSAASDPGKRRKNNEDRYYVDADRGIYAVIDGVGGHAAGETAAALAVDVIQERLERPTGTPEERLGEAITLANNEIFRLSQTRPEWIGMACVLTVALIEDDIVTVGHVGDSRLYLLTPGEIRKITRDHSPVGEREDRGELTEAEAMRHSRRNEIFRDVGSSERNPHDDGFIELETFTMPENGALLLCSDGLTDLVSSAEIRAGVERYAPDLEAAAWALIDAANHAGGKDNVTVVLVAAPDYAPMQPIPRDKTTSTHTTVTLNWTPLFLGLALGLIFGAGTMLMWNRVSATSGPRTLIVGQGGITAALNEAHSGDTVVIPQGMYRERIELRQGVTLKADASGNVTLTPPDGGPALVARSIDSGSVEGIWIQGDRNAPASAGIEIDDASLSILNVKITDAGTGIVVRGASSPAITSSQITNNLGAGIVVDAQATPRIVSNLIVANGNGKPGAAKPGVEVMEKARPVLKDNAIVDNGAEAIWIHGPTYRAAAFEENFFGGTPAKKAIRLVDVPEPVTVSKTGAKKQ
ncbi:MAG TPA: right-handed parallel beta-helix repeat-containing protein [Bryobacteraceae bacterium]|nr:right-handed parallel beta-helix repeat-containing protein [Bryobacteraceae bacterium]